MTRKVFLDASVIIAGSASRSGASRAVLNLAEIGLIQAVISEQVLTEVERNIQEKLPQALPYLTELLGYIAWEIQDDPTFEEFGRWISIIEAKDAPILEAALQAGSDYLLTLNTKDFSPDVAHHSGLIIHTPGEFIRQIREILRQNL
jgi:predicted nucleic acid-binding protein